MTSPGEAQSQEQFGPPRPQWVKFFKESAIWGSFIALPKEKINNFLSQYFSYFEFTVAVDDDVVFAL